VIIMELLHALKQALPCWLVGHDWWPMARSHSGTQTYKIVGCPKCGQKKVRRS
jgi:hypothetical protein